MSEPSPLICYICDPVISMINRISAVNAVTAMGAGCVELVMDLLLVCHGDRRRRGRRPFRGRDTVYPNSGEHSADDGTGAAIESIRLRFGG